MFTCKGSASVAPATSPWQPILADSSIARGHFLASFSQHPAPLRGWLDRRPSWPERGAEHFDVNADIGSIGGGALVAARHLEPIIAAGTVQETAIVERPPK